MNSMTTSSLENELLRRWQKNKTTPLTDAIKDELVRKFDGEILWREPMSRHTYIKIGGPADVFLKPRNIEACRIALSIAYSSGVPIHFHGWGANTLVGDGGLRGFVLCLYDALKEFSIVEKTENHVDIFAEAGLPFHRLMHFARENCLSGLESFAGIPGSLGGMIAMNAGTNQAEMQSVIRDITILTKDLELSKISREKLKFEYRKLDLPKSNLIVNATLRLTPVASSDIIEEKIRTIQKRRVETQPLNYPNLGSIFKNPPLPKSGLALTAGKLIEEAGLKGVRVGGARISPKHANFIINEGSATAKDVLALIDLIQDRVKLFSGIELTPEIKIIGDE